MRFSIIEKLIMYREHVKHIEHGQFKKMDKILNLEF